jgi:hypothetical protein
MSDRDISRSSEAPLADVLKSARDDFVPAHPERRPWHQPSLDYSRLEIAVTDNRATVNLAYADRVQLLGLDRPSYERDWLEPGDWMRGPGWGVPA